MGHQEHFTTDASNVAGYKTVNITSINSFPDPVGKEITLETNVTYNMTRELPAAESQDFRFILPTSGNVAFTSSNALSNTFVTAIPTGVALFSGTPDRLLMEEFSVTATNGGKMFDIVGSPTLFSNIFFSRARIQNFDEIGTLDKTGYIGENIGYFGNRGGLTINDSSTIAINEHTFLNHKGDGFNFTGFNTVITCSNILAAPLSGDAIYNIDSGLVSLGGVQIRDSVIVTAFGGTLFAAGGLNETSPLVRCNLVMGTAVSNSLISTGFTNGSTETVLNDTSTFVQIAGTYTNGAAQRSLSSGGVVTYNGLDPITILVSCVVQLLQTPPRENDKIQISLFKNGTEVIGSRVEHTLGALFTTTSPTFVVNENIALLLGDTIDVRMRNITKPENITATDVKILAGTNA